MKTNSLFLVAVLGVALLWLTACDNKRVYESYYSPGESGWHSDSAAVFNVPINDIFKQYNILVQVRNNAEYPNCNLWLFIESQSPTGKIKNDTIECLLANAKGEWIGRGWGSLYFIHFPFQQNVKFQENGNYKFTIRQGMRTHELKGIHDIGIRVERSSGK